MVIDFHKPDIPSQIEALQDLLTEKPTLEIAYEYVDKGTLRAKFKSGESRWCVETKILFNALKSTLTPTEITIIRDASDQLLVALTDLVSPLLRILQKI